MDIKDLLNKELIKCSYEELLYISEYYQALQLQQTGVIVRSEQLKAVEKLKDFVYEVCPLHREEDLQEILSSL